MGDTQDRERTDQRYEPPAAEEVEAPFGSAEAVPVLTGSNQ
jgi:hypothetical protein